MEDKKKTDTAYTIEREFLAKISIAEFINRIVYAHAEAADQEAVS